MYSFFCFKNKINIMEKKKIKSILKTPVEGSTIKLLPNYDRSGKRIDDFISIFYIEFDMDGKRHAIFNSKEHPMTEELKMDLYMATYLNQLCLCNGFLIDQEGNKTFEIFMLTEDMIKKYAETSGPYYDIIDYPSVEITQNGKNGMTFEMFDDIDDINYFDNDEDMINFISSREFVIDELLDEYKWTNYEKDLTRLFNEDRRLYNHRNYFRKHKINEILDT